MKKKIWFLGLVLLTGCTSKYKKEMKTLDGKYKLISYTINGVDSTTSLNPTIDNIFYYLNSVETGIQQPETSTTIDLEVHPIASNCVWCRYQRDKETDTIKIIYQNDRNGCTTSFKGNGDTLKVGPFATKADYEPHLIFINNETDLLVRGRYLGKNYDYILKKLN